MKQSIVKFLEFKGKTLLFVSKDSTYWVAIKPVCEVLNIEYTRTFKNIQADDILGPALAKQPMQVPGDQVRNMVCLPEHLIYGWIFSIKSESSELKMYKMECYQVLFNHFHGIITGRRELLGLKARAEIERGRLELQLMNNPEFLKWGDLKAQEARIGKQLKEADRSEINEQMKLFEE